MFCKNNSFYTRGIHSIAKILKIQKITSLYWFQKRIALLFIENMFSKRKIK